MRMTITALIGALALLISNSSLANTPVNNSATNTSQKNIILICPEPNALVKSTTPGEMNWTAPGPGGWKSYAPSFVKKIAHFVGAQWSGIAVGQLGCIYEGTSKMTFKIFLVFGSLTHEPSGHAWQKPKKGLRNCFSNNVKDCPFSPFIEKTDTNPYNTLDNIKKNTSNSPDDSMI